MDTVLRVGSHLWATLATARVWGEAPRQELCNVWLELCVLGTQMTALNLFSHTPVVVGAKEFVGPKEAPAMGIQNVFESAQGTTLRRPKMKGILLRSA